MANLLSCFFVCKNNAGQINANSSDDADSDHIKRHRSKHTAAPPIPKRNSTGSCHKNKLESGGHHRKSNSVSTYPAGGGGGGGKISGRNPPTVFEEESFVGTAMAGGGRRKSGKQDVEEGSFVAGNEWKKDAPPRQQRKKSASRDDVEEGSFVWKQGGGVGGARRSAGGRIEEVEESFVAGDDWNQRGGEGRGKNEKKKKTKEVKKSPQRQGVELRSFVGGKGGLGEAASFGRSWEKSQNSVSLSEWASVFKANPAAH